MPDCKASNKAGMLPEVSTGVAVISALGASALFATGTTLQYRAAGRLPPEADLAQRAILTGTARDLVKSRTWLVGTAVLAAGLGLHAVALHEGPLTLVQPLLITAVLFALAGSSYAGGPPVGTTDMRWAALLVAALAAFLLTATPTAQTGRDIDSWPAAAAGALSFIGVVACLAVARNRRGHIGSAILGIGAGIALAGSAALIKVCTNILQQGVLTLLESWQLYGLIVVGVTGLMLSQVAYRTGPMTASLPAINTVDPLVSVMIGWGVFDEHFRVGAPAITAEAVALALTMMATVALSRRSAERPQPAPPSPKTWSDPEKRA